MALLQKRPIILRSLLIVTTPYCGHAGICMCICVCSYLFICSCGVSGSLVRVRVRAHTLMLCLGKYMYTYMHTCMLIDIRMYTYEYVYMYIGIYLSTHTYIHTCIQTNIFLISQISYLTCTHSSKHTHFLLYLHTHTCENRFCGCGRRSSPSFSREAWLWGMRASTTPFFIMTTIRCFLATPRTS